MPRGVPTIGSSLSSQTEELLHAPVAREIGTLKEEVLNPPPHSAAWDTKGGTVEIEDSPPPWEVNPDGRRDNTDARRFVNVPDKWELRWVNPRLLDQVGFRDWMPVMVSDPKVSLHVPAMASPEGYVRRGGIGGDILCWMPRHWWDSRQAEKARRNARLTQRAVDKQQDLKEQFRRGQFGPYIKVDEVKHPTHTIGDGKTMTD